MEIVITTDGTAARTRVLVDGRLLKGVNLFRLTMKRVPPKAKHEEDYLLVDADKHPGVYAGGDFREGLRAHTAPRPAGGPDPLEEPRGAADPPPALDAGGMGPAPDAFGRREGKFKAEALDEERRGFLSGGGVDIRPA